jgi:dTDP-4-amino-4,6-dideoxygalactose transaminase
MTKFLDLKKQYDSIKPEIDNVISSVINESAFIGGKYVNNFENEFADYHDSKYCVSVGNGTDAIEIALEALNLDDDSEIIVPANSFVASSEAITRSGHKVVFCDCDINNYTISINSLKSKITPRTKAVIVVHLYGHPCDMDEILSIAKLHKLKIIEDCAQAHGAEYKGKRVGSIGDIGTFSFYPGKNLGAYGDGGAILTNDEQLSLKSRMIANHGRIGKYNHKFEGRNSRLDGLQAGILSVKLKHLNLWIERRISIANIYLSALSDIDGIVLPKKSSWAYCVYHLFVIRSKNRNQLREYLIINDIECGIHYPTSLPKLEAYQYIGNYDNTMFANIADEELLSLPIGEHLSNDEVERVVAVIREYHAK